jgi:type II secretion system protein C
MQKRRRLITLSAIFITLAAIEVWALLSRPKIAVNNPIFAVVEDKTEIASVASLPRNDNNIIIEDNTCETKSAEKPELKLELIGTAIGNIKDPIAFIKDLETSKQGIYKLGYKIKEAKIIRIAKGEVELDLKGIKQTLRLRGAGSDYASANSAAIISVNGDNIVMSRNALLNETGKILESAKKIKIKPFGESKQVVGMQVEGVANDSLIAQAGIHDKDVVTAVNNQKIDSYQKALQVFSKVRNQAEIKVSLLRNGETKQLNYRFDN